MFALGGDIIIDTSAAQISTLPTTTGITVTLNPPPTSIVNVVSFSFIIAAAQHVMRADMCASHNYGYTNM